MDASLWDKWAAAVGALETCEFRFRSMNRAEIWTALYASDVGKLELLLDTEQPEWRVTLNLPDECGALRVFLSRPVARMRVPASATGKARGKNAKGREGSDGLLGGKWEVCLPVEERLEISLRGRGELVESWEARIGLQLPHFS
eukprot:gene21246-25528_t